MATMSHRDQEHEEELMNRAAKTTFFLSIDCWWRTRSNQRNTTETPQKMSQIFIVSSTDSWVTLEGQHYKKINEQMLKKIIFPCHHLWKQQANNNNKTFCQISVMGKNKKRIDI